ncbi:MAG: endonuclease MutS2 [Candidatus Latescibacteria bacterium]|nr:endonuclease MutS2 [Candidatus Latescibacterota bacterium]
MKNMNQTHSYNTHALRVLEFGRVREIVASHAQSSEGRDNLLDIRPAKNIESVRELLSEVSECMDALNFDDPLPAVDIQDIRKTLPLLKIEGYNIGIEAAANVAGNLEVAAGVKEYFQKREAKYPRIVSIINGIEPHDEIVREIRKAITPDLEIADNASPELRSIRRKLNQAKGVLRDLVEKTLNNLSDDVVSERVVTLRNGRFVIPVRDSKKKNVPGTIQDRSQTGRTLFIEPLGSIEANNQVRELELAEQIEIERILIYLSGRIASIVEDLKQNQHILVRLDEIFAKARYGVMVGGVIPAINDLPEMFIKKGRHPLLDWKFRKSGSISTVVPLDMSVGGSTVTVIITGPNAGGKTVALKTIGLLTVMALSGLPVPAGPGTSVFAPSGIFADIGDEQSIEDDLSTFSSHMKNMVAILKDAGPGSLVLLDELGGATNPADGEAISLAVLKKLTGKKAVTLATTHLEGLKVFAYETDGVTNASMEFDRENLRPAFALRMGVPGSSYAFEIAARMGVPEDVLIDAETIAGGERKSLEGLITEMEEHVRRADEERKLAEAERSRLEKARNDYESKLRDYIEKKQELIDDAVTESRAIVADANRSVELAVKGIKEEKATRDSILKAKSLIREQVEKIEKTASRIPKKKKERSRKPVADLVKGQDVWVESLGSDSVVEAVLDGGRKARIRIGKSKASLVVNAKDLFQSENKHTKEQQIVRVNVRSNAVETQEIDLRGKMFDEASAELEIFLDRLHVAGIETAHIIHGKGSGALRKKISAYLDKHPFVESQRLGYWNEGSSGVTIAILKK